MAVTLTVAEAAADRLLGDGVNPPPEPTNGTLTRYLAAASELIETYAPGAPVALQNLGASLIVGYLYDAPIGDSTRYANALANSGAEAMLFRHRPRSLSSNRGRWRHEAWAWWRVRLGERGQPQCKRRAGGAVGSHDFAGAIDLDNRRGAHLPRWHFHRN